MPDKTVIVAVIMAAIVAFLVSGQMNPASPVGGVSAYERVSAGSLLRCGGAPSATNQASINAVAAELGLKIEWIAGEPFAALAAGQIDAICTPVPVTGADARRALFTTPVAQTTVQLVARADDSRFDGKTAATLNEAALTVAIMEKSWLQPLRALQLAHTQEVLLPPGDPSHTLASVAEKKADLTLALADDVAQYNAAAAVKLKAVTPLRAVALALAVSPDDMRLKNLLDTGLMLAGAQAP